MKGKSIANDYMKEISSLREDLNKLYFFICFLVCFIRMPMSDCSLFS